MAYVIYMNKLKMLTATNKINLYQHENMADKIEFIIPLMYNQYSLKDFTINLQWLDPTGVAHTEILEKEDGIYKDDYFRCFVGVDSQISRFAGDISMKLSFTMNDYDTGICYVLKTEEITIEIKTIHDYYSSINNESLEFVDKAMSALDGRIAEMEAAALIYEKTKADDIAFNEDGDVQLKANDEFVGHSISVAVPAFEDDSDESEDGVMDLDFVFKEVQI